jgi:hypothetical protein
VPSYIWKPLPGRVYCQRCYRDRQCRVLYQGTQYLDEREGKNMEPGDFLEPEVAVTAAVVAAVCSPRLRRFLRRGLVYGTAGALMAGDAITSFAKNVSEGAKQAGTSMAQATQEGVRQARETAPAESSSSTPRNHRTATSKASREHIGVQEQGGAE